MSVARDYMLEDLKRAGWEPIQQSSSIRLYEEKHTVPHVKKLPLRKFVSDDKIVVSDKPVQVTISSEDNQYFAENDSLKIYTAGNSIQFVVDEFAHHIVYFYEYYINKDAGEVMGRAAILKKLYENHFTLV